MLAASGLGVVAVSLLNLAVSVSHQPPRAALSPIELHTHSGEYTTSRAVVAHKASSAAVVPAASPLLLLA